MLTAEQTAVQDAIAIFKLLSDKLQYTTFIAESDVAIQEATLRSAFELLFSQHAKRSNKRQIITYLEVLKGADLTLEIHNQIEEILEQWNNPL